MVFLLSALVSNLNYQSADEISWLLQEYEADFHEFGLQLIKHNKLLL
jgi:hypothetical protein